MAQNLAGKPKRPHKLHRVLAKNIDQRVALVDYEIMQGKRDPSVRQIAGKLLRNTKPHQWEKDADRLFEWTRKKVRYTRDPYNVELMQSPARSLEVGIGDCDDQVIMLGSLLSSVGYPIKLRVIGLAGSDQFSHIYLMCGIPPHAVQKYKAYDPSRPEPAGWELPAQQRGPARDYNVAMD